MSCTPIGLQRDSRQQMPTSAGTMSGRPLIIAATRAANGGCHVSSKVIAM